MPSITARQRSFGVGSCALTLIVEIVLDRMEVAVHLIGLAQG